MPGLAHFLKRNFTQKKLPDSYPWHLFKELEDSFNLIEDFDQLALNFLGKIKETIPVQKLILLIFDPDMNRFRLARASGFAEGELKNITFSSRDPLAKWLKVNKSYLSVRDQPGVLDYLTPREREMLVSLGVELCYPLISMNRLIGILLIGAKDGHRDFSKPELFFISSLTPQTGIALENALLFKEKREGFRRMMRADKLATIGELAAGAAHEIRNPLTAIKSSLQYLEAKTRDRRARSLLSSALEETGRIEDILSGLLSFSRPTEIKKEKYDLAETLVETIELIAFQAKKQKVRIERALPGEPLFLEGDRSQIKQLFLNLFLNSLQAMEEGGLIKVEAAVPDSQNALVLVSDTGEGIAEENIDRVFDPFFTTKKGGTGLGLSICYGIVRSHNGEIEVQSKVGQGTTVLVKLPLKV